MSEVAAFLVCLTVFAGIYTLLQRRSGRGPVRWGWIAAIVGCAAVALLVAVLSG